MNHRKSPLLAAIFPLAAFAFHCRAAETLPPVKWPALEIPAFAEVPELRETPEHDGGMEEAELSLSKAKNAKEVLDRNGITLSVEQKAFLEEHKFLLIPITATDLASEFGEDDAAEDEMLTAFDEIAGDTSLPAFRSPGAAKLVTPDLVLHAWHRYFSHLLEYVEGIQLRPRLEKMLAGCMANAPLLAAGQPPEVKARLDWINAQFSAAWVLLGSDEIPPKEASAEKEEDLGFDTKYQVDADIAASRPSADPRLLKERLAFAKLRLSPAAAAAMEAEVTLALAAEQRVRSPLFGEYEPDSPQDYTQFRPRSHYTKTAELRSWFRCMMLLGRSGINLSSDAGLRDALLSVTVMCEPGLSGRAPVEDWQRITQVSAFFAGQSDDISYPEFRNWVAAAAGRAVFSPADALDAALIARLKAALSNLPVPRINSTTHETIRPAAEEKREFRVFGQRFGWDAWVLNKLLDDGSGRRPTLVSSTAVMAAFGDATAEQAAKDFLTEHFGKDAPRFIKDFSMILEGEDGLRASLRDMEDGEWFTSMAGKQLHTIGHLAKRDEAFEAGYMQSPLFARRRLASMIGSYSELKHDTVLYAKQNYAELGEGADDPSKPPPPVGFVQPEPVFWGEMIRLAKFAAAGIEAHRLLPDAAEEFSALRTFVGDLEFCDAVMTKQVNNKRLTEAELDRLWKLSFLYMDAPIEQGSMGASPDKDRGKTAVVTDIITGAEGSVLQIGTGRPLVMLALVGNQGITRLVTGLAYDPYEFIGAATQRMTDEEWRKGFYGEGEAKERKRPAWAVPVPAPVMKKETE